MDKLSLILSVLLSGALLIMIAPGVLALNRGKVLRNAAIWVAIFLGLGLFYIHFGPGKTEKLTEQGIVLQQNSADLPTQDMRGFTPRVKTPKPN